MVSVLLGLLFTFSIIHQKFIISNLSPEKLDFQIQALNRFVSTYMQKYNSVVLSEVKIYIDVYVYQMNICNIFSFKCTYKILSEHT